MTEVDAERLAALLDGKLDPQSRAEMLRALDASPELMEAYADAVAVRGEIDRATQANVAKQRWLRGGWIAAAAVLLIVAGLLMSRRGSRGVPMDSSAIIAQVDDRATSAARPLEPVLPVRRGETPESATEARAVQLGAQIADLGMALQAGDTAAATKAREIADALVTMPAGAPAATRFRMIEQAPSLADAQPLFADAARSAERIAGVTPVRVGVWLQVARVASAFGDTAFFANTSPIVDEASRIAIDSAARDRVAALRAQLAARPLVLPQLSPTLDAVLAALTRL